MKVLKAIGLGLAVLIVIWLALGIIMPKHITTDRSVVIKASPGQVFNAVNDLTTWEKWSPWKEKDPTTVITYGEKSSGVGGSYSWVGDKKKSGSGTMTITEAQSPESLTARLEFTGQGEATTTWKFEPKGTDTEVTWGLSSDFPFPWNAFLVFMDFKGMIHKDFDRGLELLKGYVEAQAANAKKPAYQVQEIEVPYPYMVGIRATVPMDKVPTFYAENLGKVMAALTAKGIQPAGMPCGAYFSWDEEKQESDMVAAFPVGEKVDLGAGFTLIEMPKGRALLVDYYGPYEEVGPAHMALDAYIQEKGLTQGYPVIEEYVTDPGNEPDPQKWLTKVIYPVSK